MATSLASPGIGSGGGLSGDDINPSGPDITGELGSLLSDAYDSAGGDESAGGEVSAEPSGEITGETGDGQDVSAQPADSLLQPDAVAQPGADASPYRLTEDGKFYQVPKGELPTFQTAQKYHQQVSQYFATAQEAQTASLQAADLRIMSNDWASGSEAAIKGVLNHWAGGNHSQNPAVQQRYQQSFSKMASLMPEALKTVNPQAYGDMVQGMVSRAVELAYDRAVQTQNPEDLKRAQELDWGATGKYKTELPKADPAAQAQSQFQREKAEFESRQDSALKRDVGAFNQSAVEGAKFTQLGGMIDKQLEKIKGRYSEQAYGDLKAGIQRELVDKLRSQDWYTEHEQAFHGLMNDYRTTWKQGSPGQGLQPRVQSYIQDFVSRAQRLLPSIAQPRIGAATQAATRTRDGKFAATQPQSRPPVQSQPASLPANGNKLSSDEWESQWAAVFK